MKKILISALATAVLFGCQETIENVASVSDAPTFEALVEGFSADTKTSLTELNNIVWSEGDNLAIFQGCSVADKYQLTPATAGTANGKFTLVSDNSGDINGDFTSGMEIATNVALYPYAENLSCANARLTDTESGVEVAAYTISGVVLPEVQNYVADSFGETSFPMVAMTESIGDHILKFKNVCGAMKLQLKGTQVVKSIKIEGGNSEKLSGAATITTYPDADLAPVIRMASDASTSVTLDCGDGVQLSESAATEFIIALPPVLFSKGFKVTVTTSEDVTKVIETSAANTILRSSILVMPAFKLGNNPAEEVPEEDELIIPVSDINLSSTSLKLYVGYHAQLTAKVGPNDATDKTVVWSSSDASVVTVDQVGLVTAVAAGKATIYGTAGGQVGVCSVAVSGLTLVDYVDEYDINHGKGIVVEGAVWAPVNCGYHATDYKYGKLYQWGRKYGQGYNGNLYEYDIEVGTYSDAAAPVIEEGGVSVTSGNHKSKSNVFYTSVYDPYHYDWMYSHDNSLWNSGTEAEPEKTSYDPCPEGWRVPTKTELDELCMNYLGWATNSEGVCGFSFNANISTVFLPAAGHRDCLDANATNRGASGSYWSSTAASYDSQSLSLSSSYGGISFSGRALGYSVRCVQE